VQGRISKAATVTCGARSMSGKRTATRYKRQDKIKGWSLTIAKRAGHRKAVAAVARKLAVLMHAMWSDGTVYCGDLTIQQVDATAQAVRKQRKLLEVHA
jgi:transposase